MNFFTKKALFFLCLSVVTSEEGSSNVTSPPNFSQKILNFIKENSDRYSILAKEMAKLEINHNTDAYSATLGLNVANDRYTKMIRGMSETCGFNKATRESYQSSDFGKNLQRRFDYLIRMVERTSNQTSKEVAEIQTIVTGVFEKLELDELKYRVINKLSELSAKISLQDNKIKNACKDLYYPLLTSSMVFKMPVLRRDPVEQARREKKYLEQKFSCVQKFVNGVKIYLQWVQDAGKDLQKILEEIRQDFLEVEKILDDDKKFIEDGKRSDKLEAEQNLILKKLDDAVNVIYEKSCLFFDKTANGGN